MATAHPSESSARRKSHHIAAAIAIGAALLAALALWVANRQALPAAIRQLDESERRALYERTLHTLQSSCDPQTQPQGLSDYCREQAEFIVQFPECDRTCSELAKRHRGEPTR